VGFALTLGELDRRGELHLIWPPANPLGEARIRPEDLDRRILPEPRLRDAGHSVKGHSRRLVRARALPDPAVRDEAVEIGEVPWFPRGSLPLLRSATTRLSRPSYASRASPARGAAVTNPERDICHAPGCTELPKSRRAPLVA
jgi:hypothetical protein